jgi:LacI family transcriptional regulator
MRRACHLIMRAHRALPGAVRTVPSSIQVITPYNVPTLSPDDS